MFLLMDWTKLLLALLILVFKSSHCNSNPHGSNGTQEQLEYNVVWQLMAQNSSAETINNCTSVLLATQNLFPNATCSYVQQMCKTNIRLIDYMSLALCHLEQYQPVACVIIALWLVYLIALLASTVSCCTE